MQKIIPVSTYQLLQCAFPKGIEDQEYFPLLSILYEQMSDRSLARVIAEFTEKEYHSVLNDLYQVGSAETFFPVVEEVLDSVKQKLIYCDYEKWLLES
ncbi:DUF3349 domain-containing protein [Chroococcus sp. FPU101]|uniref:DUF3349 domain-containing protein n=1 Tax=Chroococcus sp. FPU101 TaxID=1974212 RepID=UPI001A907D92|nr:DUF3349 domain-containing protein [Chroococcus sp. FPU101]GFE68140.1 hypothetical protein CFPU101_07500 [Chroococcus sp. FPU101]